MYIYTLFLLDYKDAVISKVHSSKNIKFIVYFNEFNIQILKI